MPTAEYHCTDCGTRYEWQFTLDQWPYPESIACRCGYLATRYFSRAPGMSPDPHWQGYYDVQLGKYITSRDEKRRLLKAKGLEEISAGEHDRGMESCREPEDVIQANDPKLREAMEKAYADTLAGNVEPVTPRRIDYDDVTVVS